MYRKLRILAVLPVLFALALAARPVAAQTATLSGVVTDQNGKPMPDMVVLLKSKDTGTTFTLHTDSKGVYKQIGLRPGIYDVTLKPKDKDQAIVTLQMNLGADPDAHFDIDLKKLLTQQTAEEAAAREKAEVDQKKFESMKAAYTAGQSKEDEADKARAEMLKAPSDQRAQMKDKVNGLYQEALTDFQAAQQGAPEKDPNLHLIYHQIGYSYEMMGDYNDAITAYQKSVDLKPTSADYYNSLAVAYAKAGKIPEATAAMEKAAAIDPVKGAAGWGNLGVVLYNANKLTDAIVPLQRATQANPNDARAWYLLGASLVANMDVKTEGTKMIPILKPGTIEAYQKCIALDPNGPWGAQAKDGLAQLQAMGAGVDTKVNVKKKPS
jgi:tetratricopeptide (TPR) repeat protein